MCASEKYKPQKSGGTHRYIYYGCTRGKDKTCQAGYIKEEAIVAQLLEIVDSLDISEFGMRHKFKDEMQRYNKFRRLVLGKGKETGEPDAFEVKTYAKYLLAEGTMNEKRELLANLKSRLVFKDKKITLQK